MTKYIKYSDIYFKKRSDYFSVKPELDELTKEVRFIKPIRETFKEVHVIAINENVGFGGIAYSWLYWVLIGSNDPDGILGIDFVIINCYIMNKNYNIRYPYAFYIVKAGPGIKENKNINTQLQTSSVLYPVSALTFKHFNWNSYSTKLSDFTIHCTYKSIKNAIRLVKKYFPNLLKTPSHHKNKCYCKVNNKYLEKVGLKPIIKK